MRRGHVVCALLGGFGCLGASAGAKAATLLHMSGQVAVADGVAPDGVKVKLQVDLDRNGALDSFETLSGTVAADGSYSLSYELDPADVDLELLSFVSKTVAAYEARGFDGLLDGGPLPILLSFEREGYGTVVKRLSTLFESPHLDVTLVPLNDVQCSGSTCLSPDGGVRLSGFPGGTKIARAYADAYDPSQETLRFPGTFTDSENNLLVSSGFAELNAYQEDGTPVHQLSAAVAVRFQAQPASLGTLPDLEPNSGRVELPMYSFDQARGEWLAEEDGELVLADGRVVPEDDLAVIRDGSYEEPVFVSFAAKHFSTFNCDAPIEIRACVKGKLVAKGTAEAVAGVSVSVDGVSYTGSAGTMVTGLDGAFATDVRKSELASEDLDNNAEKGEAVEARVVATGTGVFVGQSFVTPTEQGSVGEASRPDCRPADCDCVDLGELEVEFEQPRLCEVTVEVIAGNDLIGGKGPLLEGEAVVGATLRGGLVGSVQLPQAAVQAACADTVCSSSVVPESGLVTFAVPVVGDAPEIKLDGQLSLSEGGELHYYTGSLVVAGCSPAESTASGTATLTLAHAGLTGLGPLIASLGDAVKPSGTLGSIDNTSDGGPLSGGGCGCRATRARSPASGALLGLSLAGVLAWRRRRQPR